MITFKTLKVKNFKSIENAELSYDSGVWEVVGINNDSAFKSNGAGKSSLLEAIQQCLFNKTTSPTPIADTSRKALGSKKHSRGYYLALTFSDGVDEYEVINDRQDMTITVMKNGYDMMIKSMPAALKRVSSIIGMDFQTFVTLTFISHDTIVHLLDNFSSSSLMKIILNFSQISDFEKRGKTEQKAVLSQVASCAAQVQTLNTSLDVLKQFVEIDLQPLVQAKVKIQQAKNLLEDTEGVTLQESQSTLGNLQADLEILAARIRSLERQADGAVCSECGTMKEVTEEELEEMFNTIEALQKEETSAKAEYEIYRDEVTTAGLHYRSKLLDLDDELKEVDNQFIVAKTKNQMYEESKSRSDNIQEQLSVLKAEYEALTFKVDVIKTALLVLKAGDIQKDLLSSFVKVLNIHLIQFMGFISLDYVTIQAEDTKDSVSFKIQDARFNQAISIHTLSGGEKTRLRLVVLLAMLHTIKEMAAISTNILIFDESLDTLDDSATTDLANLFAYLVNIDNKFIALMSHGAQLEAINFSGVIKAEKTNGISIITKGDV